MDVKGCGGLEIPMPLTAHPESHVNKARGSEFLPTLFFFLCYMAHSFEGIMFGHFS